MWGRGGRKGRARGRGDPCARGGAVPGGILADRPTLSISLGTHRASCNPNFTGRLSRGAVAIRKVFFNVRETLKNVLLQ